MRTRDPSVLQGCHTVVDVGGEYDAGAHRFDHHQRGFDAVFPAHATKLSSAGLVYLHFGKEIIAQQTGLDVAGEEVALLYEKLYDDLVEAFDANDNGVALYDPVELAKAGVKKRFSERGFSIASVVNRLNRVPVSSQDGDGQAEEDRRFMKASVFTGEQFICRKTPPTVSWVLESSCHNRCSHIHECNCIATNTPPNTAELTDKHRAWLPARAIVKEAFDKRFEHDPKGRILVLPHRQEGIPWSDHLYSLEAASASVATQVPPSAAPTSSTTQVLYVLFPESGEEGSRWRIRAVGVEGDSFENRHPLPAAWRGVRDSQLSEVAGVPGCVFCHASGFIGGNETFEGALEMARKAVEMD